MLNTHSTVFIRYAGRTAVATCGCSYVCITETSAGFYAVQIWNTSCIWLHICCFLCWFTPIQSLDLRICVSPDLSLAHLWMVNPWPVFPVTESGACWHGPLDLSWHVHTQVGLQVFQREQVCGLTKVLRILVHRGVQEATEGVLLLVHHSHQNKGQRMHTPWTAGPVPMGGGWQIFLIGKERQGQKRGPLAAEMAPGCSPA